MRQDAEQVRWRCRGLGAGERLTIVLGDR
jgi:hypothetical protein